MLKKVSNLIEKQQKEIERLDKELWHKKLDNIDVCESYDKANKLIEKQQNEIENLKSIESEHQKENGQLQTELNSKDKVIDEMADYISKLDLDEHICSKIKNPCSEEDDCYLDVYDKCNDCIKRYFINKVKETNK